MPKYVDETGLAHFWGTAKAYVDDVSDIVGSGKFSADSTITKWADEKDYISDCNIKTAYLGRIPNYLDDGYSPQGFALISNNVGIFSKTDNTNCKFYYVDLTSGNVLDTVTAAFGHCNSMDYLASEDKLLIVPSKVSGTASQLMYVVDPSDMSVVDTIDLGFVGNSVSVDKKTGLVYVASETTYNNSYALGIYSFDYATSTTERIGTIVPSLAGTSAFGLYAGTVGTQRFICFDGNYYVLLGGHINVLVRYDADFNFDRVYNIDAECFIYTFTEFEAVSFTEDGAIIGYALGDNFAHAPAGVICTFMNGHGFNSYDTETVSDNYYRYSKCVASASLTNVYANGSEINPFIELAEAISYAVRNNLDVLVSGSAEYRGSRVDLSPANIHVIGSGAASITFYNTMYFNTNVRFEGNSASNNLTIHYSNATAGIPIRTSQFAFFKYVTFDCTNASNYVMRSTGLVILEACAFTNTGNVYSTPVDLQSRGIGIRSSTTPETTFNNKGTIAATVV